MAEIQSIQWFPGHMTRTKRKIQECLKLIDLVAEIRDARIPLSSSNPDLDKLVQTKPRLILLNKSDMADPRQTSKWVEYYKKLGILAIPIDCKSGKGINLFTSSVKKILEDKILSWQKKGMSGRSIKIMIVGIPNVGKSSFINKISKGTRAKVEDRPGVTRGNQWFSVGNGIELLDTPGVLWPKFEDPLVGEKLAFTGAIKDQILDTEQLASRLLELLKADYADNIKERYKIDKDQSLDMPGYELLALIGKKRGMLMRAGDIDLERAAMIVLDEFRSAKLGKITLEKVD